MAFSGDFIMSFELIISTMHKNTEEVLEMLRQLSAQCNVLVVVQGDAEGYEELNQDGQIIRILFTREIGLSKSRNLALKYCSSKYGYIMDDDVVIDTNAIKRLVKKMEIDRTDLATCKYICKSGDSPKKYKKTEFVHTMLSAAKVSSIEICVNVDAIKFKDIKFDQRFGLGENLPSGEEYIFVTDCIKAGLKVKYYPIVTGVHPDLTSGLDFYTDKNKTLAKREMFKRIFGRKCIFFIIAFWFKKLTTVKRAGYLKPFTKAMLFGIS